MLSQFPKPIFVDYFSPFILQHDSTIKDNSCLSTVGNDGSTCSVSENPIHNETEDGSATESSNIPTLDSRFSGDKSMICSNFVGSVDNYASIEYETMSSEGGIAKGQVGVSDSKIPVELESGKVWQSSSKPGNCDFYFNQRAFLGPGVLVWNGSYGM